MANFDAALMEARTALADYTRLAEKPRPNLKDLGPPFPRHALTDDLRAILNDLRNRIESDIRFLAPAIEDKLELDATALPRPDMGGQPFTTEGAEPPTDTQADALPQSVLAASLKSPYARNFFEKLSQLPQPALSADALQQVNSMAHTQQRKNLYTLIMHEQELCAENLGKSAMLASALPKLKKAAEAILNQKTNEAITLLRNATRENPNNKHLLFAYSQALYYRAMNGQGESLLRAREASKKCCSYGDGFDEAVLTYYRYRTAATERYFSAEKALELMRDYYLLNPEGMSGPDGLFARNGWNLRAWVLLSTIPMSLWGVYETDSLVDLVEKVEGGSVVYIHLFRKQVLTRLADNVEVFKKFNEVEKRLAKADALYRELTQPLDNFTREGKVVGGPELFWSLKNRYLYTFLVATPVPTFDEVLLHMSLDGRRYNADPATNKSLQNTIGRNFNYWRCWAASIAPDDGLRLKGLVPLIEVEQSAPVWRRLESALTALEQEEQQLIDPERWAKIQPYLANYSFSTILEVGRGRTNVHKEPHESHYVPLFHMWSTNTPEAPLISTIIKNHARKGGFVNLDEAQAMFEGAQRLLTHSVHGLAARMARAWELYERENNLKPQHIGVSPLVLFLLITPLAGLLAFFAVIMLGGFVAAVLVTLVLMLLVVIFGRKYVLKKE